MSAVLAPAACFHCGLPTLAGSPWEVAINGVARPMCCPGCAAVARTIVDSGLGAYYDTRTEFSPTADQVLPAAAVLCDVAPSSGECIDDIYSIDGIRCAACIWLIERSLARLPGMVEVNLNVATSKLHLRRDAGACKPSDVMARMAAIGYAAYPYVAGHHAQLQERARKKLFRQLFVAGLSMMQVMMYAFPAYVAGEALEADMDALMKWASLLLTLPALLYSAQPFFAGAWHGLRRGVPGMDLPVAIGIGAASVASIAATFSGRGEVYFDSVTMFIFLLLASRYLEQHARRRAGQALERLRNALPASAQRLTAFPASRASTLVAASTLREGDFLMVAPGETLPADGVLVEGATDLDLSMLTGESRPSAHAEGSEVPGGAVNITQPVVVRVVRAVQQSTLARLVSLAEQAGAGKPGLVLWADRVAAWFVAALLVLAVAVFFAWQLVDPGRAWQVAIAVLVVSCPCALSLATPTALAAATSALVRRGVLVVKPHVLETLQRATHIVFDKTGTLTEGKPILQAVHPFGPFDEARCRQIAAALEAGSAHPLALALRAGASGALVATGLRTVPGCGVAGDIDGKAYRLGAAAFAGASGDDARSPEGMTSVFLGAGGTLLARFDLADALRADALEVVNRFRRRGMQLVLLSGDGQAITDDIARRLGIGTALGGQHPADKVASVRALQAQGAVVAMVGDGVNDAAVLAAADVSFAMGGGAALAQLHADCVLLSGSLASLSETSTIAAKALAVVRQNLWWAMAYNAIAIPAAALGWISPWLSAVGMSLSSAIVVINALRLRRGRD